MDSSLYRDTSDVKVPDYPTRLYYANSGGVSQSISSAVFLPRIANGFCRNRVRLPGLGQFDGEGVGVFCGQGFWQFDGEDAKRLAEPAIAGAYEFDRNHPVRFG